MPTRGEFLAWMIERSRPLTTRYFAGFDDRNRAARAQNLPNHFAWTLGHCALTMHRLAERIDGRPLPEADFEAGAERPAGSPPMRFGTEAVAFGSEPRAEPDAYPPAARCVEVFDAACDRLARAVRSASDEQLTALSPWGRAELPLEDLIVRVTLHNAMHSGQLVDLRRSLGLPRVVG